MKNLEVYLRHQIELTKEFSVIISQLSDLSTQEKELLYLENKNSIQEINLENEEVVNKLNNEFQLMRKRIDSIRFPENKNKDKIQKLYETLNNLESNVKKLEKEAALLNNKDKSIDEEKGKVNALKEQFKVLKKDFTPKEKSKRFEFRLGTGVLSLIGIVFILVSLSTFGKYVYVSYMSDLMKGVFLFAVSLGVLGAGELYFNKKNYKFSRGITSLGVAAMYVSTIVNYLVLHNIGGTSALVLTFIITGVSIYISYRHSSSLIRIVSLIGGYICLVPLEEVTITQSYIIMTILMCIHTLNIVLPLKTEKSQISIASYEFYTLLLGLFSTLGISWSMEANIQSIFLLITTFIYSVMFIRVSRVVESKKLSGGMLLYFVVCLFVEVFRYDNPNIAIVLSYLVIGAVVFRMLLKYESRWVGYSANVIVILIYIYHLNNIYREVSALVVLALITLLLFIKEKNFYLKSTLIILILLSMIHYWVSVPEVISYIYLIIFALVLYVSAEYKDSFIIIAFKYYVLLAVLFGADRLLIDLKVPSDTIDAILICAALIYILLINNVERLKHDSIKETNLTTLIFLMIFCIYVGFYGEMYFYFSTLIILFILVFMINEDYLSAEGVLLNKNLMYSIFATYTSLRLSLVINIETEYSYLLTSILFMLVALLSVWYGFKVNELKLRKYGLGLAFVTCGKIILVDFYSFNFITKTLVFLIVGLIALGISYTYSKLEKEHQNKE